MDDNLKTWLNDIVLSIEEINDFLLDCKSFPDFQNDRRTKRAIERNIEIIGEAVNRIINSEPASAITNARKIVDTRNRIIHGYDSVSDEIIWAIVTEELPILDVEVRKLLGL